MVRNYVLVLAMVFGSQALFAQNISYKKIEWTGTKLATVQMSDYAEDPIVVHDNYEAPEPFSPITELKSELDKNRQRKFAVSHSKYKQEPAELNPAVGASFIGLSAVPGIPNDNNMAISNSGNIISVVNSSMSYLTSDSKYIQYYPLAAVVGDQLDSLDRTYDPKVLYDPDEDKFILVFLQGSLSEDTRIIVGFSKSDDPSGEWNFYAINGNPFGGNTWSDYPVIGMNKNDFFVTVNILRDGEGWQEGFTQSVIWQMDKASGFAGNDSLYQNVWYDLKFNDQPIWSICPVLAGSSFENEHMHFLSVRPDASSNDTLFVHRIDGSLKDGGNTYSLRVLQANKTYAVPPSAFQPDPSNLLQTNDTRVLSAIEEAGHIQYVQTTLIPETGASGVFHGFMNISTGEIDANYIQSDTFDYAYPSIAYAGNADFPHASVITFSHSSELHFPGTSAAFHNRLENGLSGIFSEVISIVDGEHSINRLADSLERWGDYTGIQPKYDSPGEVWMSGSYGRPYAPGSPRGRNGVQVGMVKVNPSLHYDIDEAEVTILPNPVQKRAVVRVSADTDGDYTIKLYNLHGQQVQKTLVAPLKRGYNDIYLNIEHLAAGIYVLRLWDESDTALAETKIILEE